MNGSSVLLSNNIDNWHLTDHNQGKPLDAIKSLSSRAWSLLVRNRAKPLLKFGFINVTGAVRMLEGLEYHHNNIVALSGELARGGQISETTVEHEAVAYINRLGQFYYVSMSNFVRYAISDFEQLIPTISKFMVFRNKHAAHRSIDAPRVEDTGELQLFHAGMVIGSRFLQKPDVSPQESPKSGTTKLVELDQCLLEQQRKMWTNNYRTFQIFDPMSGSHLNLTIEVEHPRITHEAYSVLEQLILFE